MKLAILIRPRPQCYLAHHRLLRLATKLRGSTVIIINNSGINYPNYVSLNRKYRVLADNWKIEQRLGEYDYIIFEEHDWSERLVTLFKKRHAIQFCSTRRAIKDFDKDLRYFTNDSHIESQIIYPGLQTLTIQQDTELVRNRLLYPFPIKDHYQLKPFRNAVSVFYKYHFQLCIPPESLVHVNRGFRQQMIGIHYRNINSMSGDYLKRASYCFVQEILPPAVVLDLLASDITPILLDIQYPYNCVDEFNAIVTSKYRLQELSRKISQVDDIPFEERLQFIKETAKEFRPRDFITWIEQ